MKPALTYQRSLFEAPVLDIKEGARLRDMGIKRAEQGANNKIPEWSDKALELVKKFLQVHSGEFMTEDVRAFAAMQDDFELPENAKAWGGVMVRAFNLELISKVRLDKTRNVKTHRTPAQVWQKT